jgi:hypothetical protein
MFTGSNAMQSVNETLVVIVELIELVQARLESLRSENAEPHLIEREEGRLKQLEASMQALQEQLANS